MVSKLMLYLLLVIVTSAYKIRYDDYQILRVIPETEVQLQALRELKNSSDGMRFRSGLNYVNHHVDILISPQKLQQFKEYLRLYNMESKTLIENVQRFIDLQKPAKSNSKFGWDNYYDLNETYQWLDSLITKFPNITSIIVGGSTYEGRQIKGIKISYKDGNRGVFLESGIHADEWIGPATATWIINELLTSSDSKIRNIAENYDWYVFPIVNADGHHYSHTTDRFWRKTRSPVSERCYGVDPNRNWDIHWLEEGASNEPCSHNYAGPKPFSEVEILTFSQYVTSLKNKIQIYIDFHSYGQMLMFPFGYTVEHMPEYSTMLRIGNKTAESLAARYGTRYTVGSIAEIIYVASGSSLDWMYEKQNIPINYVYELRDNGETGGLLPAEQIIPTGQETLDSIVTMLEESSDITSMHYKSINNITLH